MKKKILYILVAALLYILTQVPTIVSNYYFEPGNGILQYANMFLSLLDG